MRTTLVSLLIHTRAAQPSNRFPYSPPPMPPLICLQLPSTLPGSCPTLSRSMLVQQVGCSMLACFAGRSTHPPAASQPCSMLTLLHLPPTLPSQELLICSQLMPGIPAAARSSQEFSDMLAR